MEQLRQVILALLAVAAVISLAGMAGALYEFRTGRLIRYLFRRKVPATPEDIRKNGLALVLNELGALLVDLIVLSGLLLEGTRFNPVLGVSYFTVGAAGFAASFLSFFTALHLRGEVRFRERQKAVSVPSAPALAAVGTTWKRFGRR